MKKYFANKQMVILYWMLFLTFFCIIPFLLLLMEYSHTQQIIFIVFFSVIAVMISLFYCRLLTTPLCCIQRKEITIYQGIFLRKTVFNIKDCKKWEKHYLHRSSIGSFDGEKIVFDVNGKKRELMLICLTKKQRTDIIKEIESLLKDEKK